MIVLHSITIMLYFGYGSNMDAEQMKRRCPEAKYLGIGVLRQYRLVERLYADIERDESDTVYGAVYELTPSDLKSLDKYEGYPVRYTRYETGIELDGKELRAIVYQMTEECKAEREGKKYPNEYRLRCRNAANVRGVLELYIKNGKTPFE